MGRARWGERGDATPAWEVAIQIRRREEGKAEMRLAPLNPIDGGAKSLHASKGR